MLEATLFCGVEIDDELRKQLLYANPHAVDLFINGADEYLQEIEHEGKRYLGKLCGRHQLLDALDLVQTNVTSLIRRLLPDFEERSFIYFATGTPTG